MQYLLTPEEYEETKRRRLTHKEFADWDVKVRAACSEFTKSLGELGVNYKDHAKEFRELAFKFIQSVGTAHQTIVEK